MSGPASPTTLLKIAGAILGGGALVGVLYAAVRSGVVDPIPSVASQRDIHDFGDRILVIAPHPDDEVIGPGGLIALARENGVQVRVVLVTVGDGYRRAAARLTPGPLTPASFLALGLERHRESSLALASLGVPPEDRIYLAYADGSINSLWDRDWDLDHPHLGSSGQTRVPYPFAEKPGTVFCGANLAGDLERIISEYKPTSVVYPDPSEHHHDHWATSAFTEYALDAVDYPGRRMTYIVHVGLYPFPWAYAPGLYLRPPPSLKEIGTHWGSLPLPEAVEQRKHRAIDDYASQMRVPDLRVFLLAFVRRNELFGTWSRPALRTIGTDTPPVDDPRDVVIHEPPSKDVALGLSSRRRIRDIRMVRGPHRVWVGITGPARPPRDARYDFRLRLLGGSALPARLDVAIIGDKVEVMRLAADSLAPQVKVSRSGDTTWIGLPLGIFADHTFAMVSGQMRVPADAPKGYRSVWRSIRL